MSSWWFPCSVITRELFSAWSFAHWLHEAQLCVEPNALPKRTSKHGQEQNLMEAASPLHLGLSIAVPSSGKPSLIPLAGLDSLGHTECHELSQPLSLCSSLSSLWYPIDQTCYL